MKFYQNDSWNWIIYKIIWKNSLCNYLEMIYKYMKKLFMKLYEKSEKSSFVFFWNHMKSDYGTVLKMINKIIWEMIFDIIWKVIYENIWKSFMKSWKVYEKSFMKIYF